MKFMLGPMPENDDFHPSETGWSRIKETSPVLLHLLALPVAVVLMVLTFLFCRAFLGPDVFRLDMINMALVYWTIVIVIPIHEVVHAISTPSWGMSDKTVVGFWPRKVLPYAIYTDALTRTHIIWFIFMPFLILTVFPATVMCLLRLDIPVLYYFILVNAGCSGADIVQVPIFLSQVPRGGIIRNKGFKSYWRA